MADSKSPPLLPPAKGLNTGTIQQDFKMNLNTKEVEAQFKSLMRGVENSLSKSLKMNVNMDDIKAARESITQMTDDLQKGTKVNLDDSKMLKIVNAMTKARKSGLFDDVKSRKYLSHMENGLRKLGVSKAALSKLDGQEIKAYEELSLLQKARIKMKGLETTTTTQQVLHNGKLVELETKKHSMLAKTAGATWSTAKGTANTVAGMAGIDLSLMGIVRLLINFMDVQNQMGAMSKQIAYQWAGSTTSMKTARHTIGAIKRDFWMSAEAAGALVNSVARAGIEEKNLESLTKNMVAWQTVSGMSVESSLGAYKDLARSFGQSEESTWGMYRGFLEASKTIPELSMDEAAADMANIVDKTREFGTGLLGATSLYNVLLRKGGADALGLGGTTFQMRKGLVNAATAFNDTMSDGMKAWLGGLQDPIESLFKFEAMNLGEKLQALFTRTKEMVGQGATPKEALLKTRKFLEPILSGSMKPMEIKSLVEKLMGGFLNIEGFTKEALDKQAQALSDSKTKAKKQDELYQYAKSIATGLTGFEDKLRMAMEDALMKVGAKTLLATMNRLSDWIINEVPNMVAKLITLLDSVIAWFMDDEIKAAGNVAGNIMQYGPEQTAKTAGELPDSYKDYKAFLSGSLADLITTNQNTEQSKGITVPEDVGSLMQQYVPNFGTLSAATQKKAYVNLAATQIGRKDSGAIDIEEIEAYMAAVRAKDWKVVSAIIKNQFKEKAGIARQLTGFKASDEEGKRKGLAAQRSTGAYGSGDAL